MSVMAELVKFIDLSRQLIEQNYGDMWAKLHAGELNELEADYIRSLRTVERITVFGDIKGEGDGKGEINAG